MITDCPIPGIKQLSRLTCEARQYQVAGPKRRRCVHEIKLTDHCLDCPNCHYGARAAENRLNTFVRKKLRIIKKNKHTPGWWPRNIDVAKITGISAGNLSNIHQGKNPVPRNQVNREKLIELLCGVE